MTPVRQSIGGLGNLMFKQAYLIGKLRDGEIPDVYLQSSKYWERHKDVVKEYFQGLGPMIDKVAIHIRLGDYLKAEHFHTSLVDSDYYATAIKMFPGREFLVFCKDNQGEARDLEDREYACEIMKSLGVENYKLAPWENSETDDMNLMASCKDIIMANSSFSWWAAFLGIHDRVICPKEDRWFVDGQKRVDLEANWIQL